jgi:hypothetical protein
MPQDVIYTPINVTPRRQQRGEPGSDTAVEIPKI